MVRPNTNTSAGTDAAAYVPLSQTLGLSPEHASFVVLSFEGPDAYARAGGLGVRITELTQALTEAGYTVHLLYVGDPDLPGEESVFEDRLVLHRWCQWISA